MAYTPTEWESADVVTAVRMNALENAVGDIDMSYTPNVWSDGDILTADKMNALEQAVASGGGGGSSDFSTAEVTIVNNKNKTLAMYIPMIFSEDGFSALVVNDVVDSGENQYTVPLYQGVAYIIPNDNIGTPVISGDCEYDDFLIVSGDCTITIS